MVSNGPVSIASAPHYRFLLVTAVLVGGAGCDAISGVGCNVTNTAPEIAKPLGFDGAAGLYAPLLRESYHGRPASQMVVTDTAVAMPTLRVSSSEWARQFDEVPSELRRAARQPSPTASHRLGASLLPRGTRLVSAAAVEANFRGSGIDDKWSAFRLQFSAQGWLAFSDGLLADDQLNALVYFESHCGGLCGEGGYVWLRRDTASSPWRIAKMMVSWMA